MKLNERSLYLKLDGRQKKCGRAGNFQNVWRKAAGRQPHRLMNQSRIVTVSPARSIRGELRLPGDKSISHRYALLAAIAEGRTRIENFAPGADCRNTVDCVQALGREVSFVSGSERGSTAVASRIPQAEALLPPNSAKTDTVEISGLGAMLCAPATALDCGN